VNIFFFSASVKLIVLLPSTSYSVVMRVPLTSTLTVWVKDEDFLAMLTLRLLPAVKLALELSVEALGIVFKVTVSVALMVL
jgi:hypothetical protein